MYHKDVKNQSKSFDLVVLYRLLTDNNVFYNRLVAFTTTSLVLVPYRPISSKCWHVACEIFSLISARNNSLVLFGQFCIKPKIPRMFSRLIPLSFNYFLSKLLSLIRGSDFCEIVHMFFSLGLKDGSGSDVIVSIAA